MTVLLLEKSLMKIAVYSTKQYDKKYLQHVNDAYGFELEFLTSC